MRATYASDPRPEMLFEFIRDTLAGAQIHAQLGITYAEIGDIAGLNYSARSLVACTRAAVSTLADLNALRKVGAQTVGSPAEDQVREGGR
ncbi:hypothetical protein [uncultured Methylobacterium sp.]|uniref:hypothetical protein n=1 Tax=uncultured Methylobacterium sp. TaxID=157278 RepID=UPI0035CAF724